MPDLTSIPQEMVRGFDLGAILSLQPHPAIGYLLMLVGLALCLAGYWLYRLMVALAAAVAGGALASLLLPGVGVDGVALWSGVLGAMLILAVVGWFLYAVAVFLVGAFAGLMLGAGLWLLTSERFASAADLRQVTFGSGDLPHLAAATLLPAAILGILAVKWERGAVSVISVVLGGLVFALGLRYGNLRGPTGDWSAALAGLVTAAGFYANFRPRGRGAKQAKASAPRGAAATK